MKDGSTQADVLRQAKENCLIRPKDFRDIKGVRVIIARLVENGQLIKLRRGIYAPADANFNEQQSLLEAARSIPNGVICLVSALQFHNITTQSPYEIWIAIEGASRKPKIQSIPLRIMRFSRRAFTEGIETHNFEGILLKIYNPPKTVADCFKFRNKIGLDIAIEALRDVWRGKKATMDELWHYAKICRVSNVMRPYLETLV